ncbi:MAG TPA: ABC transporter permease subunit, partial [Acidimicrobiales bacterium]|nr:ABC transporter permease subunit [Acidimicrobiales bacterium]
ALPNWLKGVIGFLAVVALWELLTVTVASGQRVWPSPWSIVTLIWQDGWSFYWPNIETTLWEAARGFLWGNLLAIVLALLVMILPIIERPLVQLSVVSYCLPIVALAPIFTALWSGETPKVMLAAMAVFFTTLIGMLVGLRSADATSLDLVHAYGGGRFARLFKVRAWACLPSLFAALRIAAPAAVLGAIIGEYLGGFQGLGVAMIVSEQSLDVTRTWGIALVSTAIGSLGYVAMSLLGRLATPWTRRAS